MKIERVNIGEIIKKKVLEKRISIASFAKSIGLQRQNVEKTVFRKHGLDTDLLVRISEELGHNFFQYYKCNDECNKLDYTNSRIKEVKASITLQIGEKTKEEDVLFVFDG